MTDKEILRNTWNTRTMSLITVDDHRVYGGVGVPDSFWIPVQETLKCELKSGFTLHAKGLFHDNIFDAYSVVIDNHVGVH